MSTTIPVPTRECTGIDVSEGGRVVASYDARNGYVRTDNPNHARLIERTFGSRKLFGVAAPARAIKQCPCGRPNFASTQVCPVCGADISAVEVVDESVQGS